MTNKDIKQIFHSAGLQINPEALKLVQDHLKKETILMANRTKAGNFKRLTPEHFWVAIANWGFESPKRRLG